MCALVTGVQTCALPICSVAELLCIAATAVLIGHALCRDDPFRRIIAAHMLSWIGIQSLFIYLVPVIQQRMPGLDHAALGRVTALAYLALTGVAALDRKSVVSGKSVSVRVDLGGRRIFKKQKK